MRRLCMRTSCSASALYWSVASQHSVNLSEMLNPPHGESAGESEASASSYTIDFQDPRKRPWYNHKVSPIARKVAKANTYYFKGMRDWGYHSLTMFKHLNEDTGFYAEANSNSYITLWNMVGEHGVSNFWCNIRRRTNGLGCFNLRPSELRSQAWGYRTRESNAIHVRYDPLLPTLQKYCLPHTAEHARHQRLKNPDLVGYTPMNRLLAKRTLREVQWHLGEGLRYYLVDGVFGSDGLHHTPYRIITDNPTHAYYLSMAAIRDKNILAEQEVPLIRRVGHSPLEEWAWRRPGVLVYHVPTYQFEAPRIVEEFAGPRPSDLGLTHERFIMLEPYSIPMKAVVSAEPQCDVVLDVTSFLCARWGFYADEAGLLTLPCDSVLSHDGTRLTLILCEDESGEESPSQRVNSNRDEGSDSKMSTLLEQSVRSSPYLYGYRHHRIGTNGIISRAWDVRSCPVGHNAPLTSMALIEEDYNRCHEPLPTRIGLPQSISHRFYSRRNLDLNGYMLPHRYTNNTAEGAYAAGLLFNAPSNEKNENDKKEMKKTMLERCMIRPRGFHLQSVDVLIILSGKASSAKAQKNADTTINSNKGNNANELDAAEAIMRVLRSKAFVYAEEDVLKNALRAEFLQKVNSVRIMYSPSQMPSSVNNSTTHKDIDESTESSSSETVTRGGDDKNDQSGVVDSENSNEDVHKLKEIKELLKSLSAGNTM